jgi:hypothetical protein
MRLAPSIARRCFVALATALFAAAAASAQTPPANRPWVSEHRSGPDGLEGWTLSWPQPDRPNERYPGALVIARHGRVIRQISGNAFVWKWIFWADGKQVAYESGPLHFGLSCMLTDIETGRVLANVDCFHGIPEDAPDWLKTLEAKH